MTATGYASQASELFVLSDSFIRIKELVDDESSTIDDISEVIIIDPALAGTILKLANSSFFNYPGKIDTISKAVLVLGITEVYNLVIAFFTQEAFKSINANRDFLECFWQQSVDCALLIKFFGGSLNIPSAERLFILGILHNLGELVVKQISPEKFIECQNADDESSPWDKQKQVLGFTYGECGAELLKKWHLPYNLVAPISKQDEDDFSLLNKETQLLYIAKRIVAHKVYLKPQEKNLFIEDEKLSTLGINEEMLRSAASYCDLERLSILSVLNPASVTVY